MSKERAVAFVVGALLVIGAVSVSAEPSLMENLGRGVVAIRQDSSNVYVGWRLLGTDPPDITFNLYRSTGGGDPALLNGTPIGDSTNFVDTGADLGQAVSYFVRPVVGGLEQDPSASFTLPANAPANQYLSVPLQVPPDGVTVVGEAYTYSANDASVGDLDGDGEYEIILKWDPSNSKDNATDGYTGNVYLDAYKLSGARLWRIDLGRNIRAGAHYTQFMVYDLDGDGKAEVAAKTADGTIDGAGQVIGDPNADYRSAAGRILDGPEFLTIFNGQTGATLVTTDYLPGRGDVCLWGNDSAGRPECYGNRVDRFLAAIAYLDGQRPSLVMCRGYYARAVLVAWNWRDGVLTHVWTFDSNDGTPGNSAYQGQGNHNLSVGDIDGDGKQEIVYGAAAIDDDGTGLYATGWGHGDALHLSDMDPDRPGLEVLQPHEVASVAGAEFRDANTGQLIWGVQTGGDNGRGMADDIDPTRRGFEMWTGQGVGLRDTAGNRIGSSTPPVNFAVWWDADLTRELLDGTTISKWDWTAGSAAPVLSPPDVASNNSTKANPTLSADILGDWREEVVWRAADSTALRIYTTTIQATNRIYTLMHDPQYRVSIAWQNVAYNQPPHPSFFLGDGMNPPPTPDIVTDLAQLSERAATPVITGVSDDLGVSSTDRITSDTTLLLNGTAGPGDTVTVSKMGVGVLGTAGVDPSGNWTFDIATELLQGNHYFTATATDSLGHTSGAMPPFQVVVDATAPTVVSVSRLNPLGELTSANAVTFRVAFSERAAGVTTGSFALVTSGTVTGVISAVSASQGFSIEVSVTSIVGLGTLALNVKDTGSGIADIAGNPLSGGFTSGETYTFINPTWIQAVSGGLWSDPANWSGGVIGEGLGLTASFNALDLTAEDVVHLDSPHTIGSVIFGDADTATPASWIIDNNGDPANALTLAVASGNPTVTVNAMGTGATTTISAGVATAAGLTKTGAGVLALAGPSTIPGTTTVSGGVLRVAPGGTFTPAAVAVGPAGAQLNIAGGSFAATGNVRVTPGSGAGVYVDSGTATFNTIDTTNSAGGVVRFNGGTITANDINFPRSADGTPSYNSGLIVTGGTATVGTIRLGTNNSNASMSIEGGSLLATGAVTLGNQASSGRGGHMQVKGGAFTSTDTTSGVIVTYRSGNTSDANFLGGVSTVEKLTLGFSSSVIAGSATVNVNGGALYVGSGGIVKNGVTAFTTNLSFTSGVLGAKADWSTALPVTLPAGGNLALKAADAADQPHAIVLNGILAGAGGFTKTGAGTLTLSAANTFAGPVAVNGGVLEVSGSLATGSLLAVNAGGTLVGAGTIARGIALNEGGQIVPGSAAPGSVLSGESLAWSGGGQLVFDLAAGNRLALTGALTKAGLPLQHVVLGASAPLTVGVAYPLATFASTDLLPSDLSYSGLNGYLGVFLVGPNSLSFLVTGAGPTAEYTHWAYLAGLPDGQNGPADDPDNDGQTNLLEFVLGHDPMRTSVEGILATTVVVEERRYPAISFVRRVNLGGVTTDVLVSPDLTFSTQLGWVEVSAESRGDGTEAVVVRSAVSLSRQPRQFFRLAATLPAFSVYEQTTVLSTPVGVLTERLPEGLSGLAMPLIAGDLLIGIVETNSTSALAFPAGEGSVGALLSSGGKYYVEVLTGPFAGERLDVDTEATIAAGDSSVALALGPETFSTLPELAADVLVGARCALRPHVTLASLQAMITPGLRGSNHAHFADGVLILEDHGFELYTLRSDGTTWYKRGSKVDQSDKVIPPDVSILVQTSSHRQRWRHAGQVRTNVFRKNLVAGLQAFATGFPEDLTPVEIGAFVDPEAPAQTSWTGSNFFTRADQIQRVAGHHRPFDLYYLRADGTSWQALRRPQDVANQPILGVTDMLLLRRVKSNPTYAIAPPFGM